MKKCQKCTETKPLDEFHYIYSRQYYISSCKDCEKERKHALYIKNKERVQEQNKKYRSDNKESIKQAKHRYYLEHKDSISQKKKQWADNNRERNQLKYKKYYQSNKSYIDERNKEYYSKNRTKIREQRKNAYMINKPKHLEQQRARYHANISLKLGSNLRNRVRKEIGSGKKYLELLGCKKEKLIKWFEFNFQLDGNVFNWQNYGTVWQIDHVRPCKIYDLTVERNRYICFNWKNTMPVTTSYNHKKNGKIVKEDILKVKERVALFKEALSNGSIKID